MTRTSRWYLLGVWCVIAVLMFPSVDASASDGQDDANSSQPDPRAIPTHQQIGTIKIGDEVSPRINTFAITSDDRILVACGGPRAVFPTDGSAVEIIKEPGEIQIMDLDGKLLDTITVDFKPQAINVDDAGNVYVAGPGRIVKFDKDWNELARADRPGARSIAQLAKEQKANLVKNNERTRDIWLQRIEDTEQAIKERAAARQGKEVPKGDASNVSGSTDGSVSDGDKSGEEKDAADKEKIRRLRNMIAKGEKKAESFDSLAEWYAHDKLTITGIAAADSDVYLACHTLDGYTYEVYRLDGELKNAEKIVTGLRGCCGQMDIQSSEGCIFAAENIRFRVVQFDHDGKKLSEFGGKVRDSIEGFGSCCNPMNIRFGRDGDIYTAESSVGSIKRFSRDGEFLGTVGRANLIPGCKNVAIDMSRDGDRVYMLDISRSQIYILGRKSETPRDK